MQEDVQREDRGSAEPVVEVEPQPQETVVETGPAPDTVLTPEPDPVVELEPEPDPVIELESESVLEISHSDLPGEEAPGGLSFDAFKDIKPVAFGGAAVEDEAPAMPEPPPAPEPAVEPQPEPTVEVEPEPVVEVEPEPVVEPEPIVEPEPALEFEPISHPIEPEPASELEPEPAMAAAVAEPVAEEAQPKKRGFRLPNPELKLPSFGKKKSGPPAKPKAKGGLKLPQITLPPNLQGPLSDLERKIVLGSVVAVVAAGALGYTMAPSDDAGAVAPTPAPAAAGR